MKKTRKLLVIVAMATLIGLSFSGCGSYGAKNTDSSSGTVVQEEQQSNNADTKSDGYTKTQADAEMHRKAQEESQENVEDRTLQNDLDSIPNRVNTHVTEYHVYMQKLGVKKNEIKKLDDSNFDVRKFSKEMTDGVDVQVLMYNRSGECSQVLHLYACKDATIFQNEKEYLVKHPEAYYHVEQDTKNWVVSYEQIDDPLLKLDVKGVKKAIKREIMDRNENARMLIE